MPRQRKKDDAAVRDERLNDPSLVKAARLLGQPLCAKKFETTHLLNLV